MWTIPTSKVNQELSRMNAKISALRSRIPFERRGLEIYLVVLRSVCSVDLYGSVEYGISGIRQPQRGEFDHGLEMDAGPPSDHDDALLARLNALKVSNVTLGTYRKTLTSTLPPESQEDPVDLIERFTRLHGRTSVNGQDNTLAQISSDNDDGPPSPTIEELLAELGPEDEYTVNDTELVEANQLLAEAKRILPTDFQTQRPKPKSASSDETEDVNNSTEAQVRNQEEDVEVKASLERILDEVKLKKEQEPSASPNGDNSDTFPSVPLSSFASLEFPSVPETPLQSFNFPPIPTMAPSTYKARTKPQEFSKEEIDSWCIICCANAAVKCFGCDNDLYCWGCWREGHVGEDVGLDEKRHVWYVRLFFLYPFCH